MKIRIITQLEDLGDNEMRVNVYGESGGDDNVSRDLLITAALLKERIKKVVNDFDPEKVTLKDLAQLQDGVMELRGLKAKEGEVSHE